MLKKPFYFLIISLFLAGVAIAQNYEIKFDTLSASGWFGGDDRECCGPRNIGVAQSVLVEESITLETFSFYFTSSFDFPGNPTGNGHEVTLVLNIRDSVGTILQTEEDIVPDTFDGGWVTWDNINLNVMQNTSLIFSCYLAGGYDILQVNSAQGCDANAGYPNGVRYTKLDSTDTGMEEWVNWNQHSWDANFWLTGTLIPTAIGDNENLPVQYSLEQNYPNPFNPATVIRYSIPEESFVEIVILNLLGEKISTLISERQQAGSFNVRFDASGLPSGIYFYRIVSDKFTRTKKMMLLK